LLPSGKENFHAAKKKTREYVKPAGKQLRGKSSIAKKKNPPFPRGEEKAGFSFAETRGEGLLAGEKEARFLLGKEESRRAPRRDEKGCIPSIMVGKRKKTCAAGANVEKSSSAKKASACEGDGGS